jgi:polyisoprenoid-binding protein YceI
MARYVIDTMHSDIEFKVKHLMISTVSGRFTSFDATMETQKPDFSDAKINFVCDVNSISTKITDRDNHLKSPDFFDAENYPKISFASTKISKRNEIYTIKGILKIKDVEKEVILKGSYNGNDVDNYGQIKYGFELEGKINRADYDLSFNIKGGKGSVIIGDEVKLNISIQMMKTEDDKI